MLEVNKLYNIEFIDGTAATELYKCIEAAQTLPRFTILLPVEAQELVKSLEDNGEYRYIMHGVNIRGRARERRLGYEYICVHGDNDPRYKITDVIKTNAVKKTTSASDLHLLDTLRENHEHLKAHINPKKGVVISCASNDVKTSITPIKITGTPDTIISAVKSIITRTSEVLKMDKSDLIIKISNDILSDPDDKKKIAQALVPLNNNKNPIENFLGDIFSTETAGFMGWSQNSPEDEYEDEDEDEE